MGVSGNLFLNANTASGGSNFTHRRRVIPRCSKLVALAAELDFVSPLAAAGISLRRIRMSIAAELLQRHIQTLVDDHQEWQTLIADDILWELAYAPAIGHPAKLSGRDEVLHHVRWFLGAVENFRFIDPKVYAFTDPQAAVAQVKAEALIKPTGRIYRQEYVVFLRAAGDKIAYLREYFDPTRAAKSMDATILDLEPWF